MEIDKAIGVLDETFHHSCFSGEQSVRNALKLGIEALKVVQSNRTYGYPNKIPKLPGETES